MIRNILVAVDGSENSDRALGFALDLGEKYDAAVTILNVSEPLPMVMVPEGTTVYSDGGIGIINKDLMKIHEELLSKAVARARTVKANLAISSALREGEPAYEIVNAAKEGGFDVIVIGHRGMGKVEELFLGSVSMKVAHLTPCPVIIVR